jgi:hypothetical protein
VKLPATRTPSWSLEPPLAQVELPVLVIVEVHVPVPTTVALTVISKRTQLSDVRDDP